MSRKVCMFGMDGFIVPMMRKFAVEGNLPNFGRIIKEGTVNQTQPSFPVWTPTNWATLVTGAHTGTHGASRWSVDKPEGRLDSFDGRALDAERIWTALERAGMKGAAIHYPAAYPSDFTASTVVDGFGHPGMAHTEYEIACFELYVAGNDEGSGISEVMKAHDGSAWRGGQEVAAVIPTPTEAREWRRVPGSSLPPLESTITVTSRIDGSVTSFPILLLADDPAKYTKILVCREKDGDEMVAEVRPGEWSRWATEEFIGEDGPRKASLRFKLLELSPDGKHLSLYRTQTTFTDGYSHPDETAMELTGRFGPYQEHASFIPYEAGYVDFDTALEECRYQGLWFADSANFLLHEQGHAYFTCHWHLFDYLNHIRLHFADPSSPAYDRAGGAEVTEMFRRAYIVADEILGRLMERADAETFIGIVSDHGAMPDLRAANLRKFLHEKGFLHLKRNQESLEEDWAKEEDIDWEATTAYPKAEKGFDIYINAPEGPEFDEIERRLLLELRTWVDEEIGRCPIALALPKRDAYILGQWGSQCGDVVFVWDHGYCSGYLAGWQGIRGGGAVGAPEVLQAHHGGFLPTDNGLSSSYGTFMVMGPGIRHEYSRDTGRLGYIHMTDVVPTCCHILSVRPPTHSQGAVAYDIFENQEDKTDE